MQAVCRLYFCALSQKLQTGAVEVWGKVGVVQPPDIVLPITVEPSKPSLCIDAHFLNLRMKDLPFSLDKLIDVPRFVYKNSFMSKIDDKSRYDHILLTNESSTYFGIEWEGLWWVCTTLPFGWKNSPYVPEDWPRCHQLLSTKRYWLNPLYSLYR